MANSPLYEIPEHVPPIPVVTVPTSVPEEKGVSRANATGRPVNGTLWIFCRLSGMMPRSLDRPIVLGRAKRGEMAVTEIADMSMTTIVAKCADTAGRVRTSRQLGTGHRGIQVPRWRFLP